MERTGASRKRPAPGTIPMAQQPMTTQQPFEYPQMPSNADLSNFDFSTDQFPADSSGYADPTLSDINAFNMGTTSGYGNPVPPPLTQSTSTDLVRRTRNSQVGPPAGQGEQWNGFPGVNGQTDEEDEQELERRVAMAKKDAQGKRKQIPPFVQKLSSFLDSNNTDLIRWSDDGRSFIVIDEDEFARTLIPELFKHNNYPSFVRQLNMYGFHKTVNITDGSLRQSEKARKGVKPPSMYSHPYFRRNRPDLLWLIIKPPSKSTAKRKRDDTIKGDFDSDDERQYSPGPDGRATQPGRNANQDLTTLPRNEMTVLRQELRKLQSQQNVISRMITQLKEQNDQFYRQASAFQALHDRHENSINAILTFLATFYNRSLEGHAGQNLVNMFANPSQQTTQHQGGVVEDFTEGTPEETSHQLQRYKRPQLLLPAPGISSNTPQPYGNVSTAPASPAPPDRDARGTSARTESVSRQSASAPSPVVKSDAPTPNVLDSVPDNDEMMSLINSVNASSASSMPSTAAPAFDFSSALSHYENANGNSPLSAQQRNDMLALMANQHASNTNTNNTNNGNNALTSPQPPTMPDLAQLKQTQQQLEMLTNMQKAQDAKVQELNRRLQPLSPTGAIPGLAAGETAEGFFDPGTGNPGDFDPNAFINFDNDGDLSFDFAGAGDEGDGGDGIQWDFGNTGAGGGQDLFQQPSTTTGASASTSGLEEPDQVDGGGTVESVSSEAASPATGNLADVSAAHSSLNPGAGMQNKRVRRS